MNKRYQVFISSTFTDLIEERQAVLKAILELDQFPAGMELFPAVDSTAWDLIKDVIRSSDYYVLIIGGRYGSVDEEGLSYTQKEYEYAVAEGKPVIPLLHKSPEALPRDKTETEKEAWENLNQFRENVEANHTCVYWESPLELKSQLIIGLTATMKRMPTIGWIRADQLPSEDTTKELLDLRKKVDQLQGQLDSEQTEAPEGASELSQGAEIFTAGATVHRSVGGHGLTNETNNLEVKLSWNEIFSAIGPMMIDEAPESDLTRGINSLIDTKIGAKVRQRFSGSRVHSIQIKNDAFQTVIVQLRALGLIAKSVKQRSVKDKSTYWTLTGYGDNVMVNLRAIRKGS